MTQNVPSGSLCWCCKSPASSWQGGATVCALCRIRFAGNGISIASLIASETRRTNAAIRSEPTR